jgi:hypothetical protein
MVDPKHIGTQFEPFSYAVERDKVREFAEAIADPNPAYVADDPTAFALPPTFPTVFTFWGAGEKMWKDLEDIGVDLLHLLHAEQEFEYLAPILPGDTVTGQTTVADVYTKSMRAVTLEYVVAETAYTNQRGQKVLREVLTILVRHDPDS